MTDSSRMNALRGLLDEDPGDPFLRYAVGLEHLKMNDLASAREAFTKVVSDSPHYLPAYYQLGKVLEQLNEAEQAIKSYQAGIALATEQRNMHTLSELRGALQALSGEGEAED